LVSISDVIRTKEKPNLLVPKTKLTEIRRATLHNTEPAISTFIYRA